MSGGLGDRRLQDVAGQVGVVPLEHSQGVSRRLGYDLRRNAGGQKVADSGVPEGVEALTPWNLLGRWKQGIRRGDEGPPGLAEVRPRMPGSWVWEHPPGRGPGQGPEDRQERFGNWNRDRTAGLGLRGHDGAALHVHMVPAQVRQEARTLARPVAGGQPGRRTPAARPGLPCAAPRPVPRSGRRAAGGVPVTAGGCGPGGRGSCRA